MKRIGVVIISLIAVLAMATTAYAAEWKLDENNAWVYVDKDGEKVTDTFKKSGDNWYYLNDEGVLANDEVIENNNKYYYINDQGIMIFNAWVWTKKDADADEHWMHFGTTGKADESSWKSINDKKYHFTDAIMDYGFLDENGSMIDAEDELAWQNATYYCGAESNGSQYTGWLKVEGVDNESGYVWLFFGTNGKKYVDCVKTINGAKYGFDSNGAMIMEWAIATVSTASGSNYYKEDSGLIKKAWFWGVKGDEEDPAWYYFDVKGEAYTDTYKKINGKWYAFDSTGKMFTGFVFEDGTCIAAEDAKKSDFTGAKFAYAKESDDIYAQGAFLTGKQTIECQDGALTFNFNSRGIANEDNNGFQVVKGYLYENAVLVTPSDDHKYEIIDSKLINKSGKVCKKGNYIDSDYEVKYVVDADGNITIQHKNSDGKWE